MGGNKREGKEREEDNNSADRLKSLLFPSSSLRSKSNLRNARDFYLLAFIVPSKPVAKTNKSLFSEPPMCTVRKRKSTWKNNTGERGENVSSAGNGRRIN